MLGHRRRKHDHARGDAVDAAVALGEELARAVDRHGRSWWEACAELVPDGVTQRFAGRVVAEVYVGVDWDVDRLLVVAKPVSPHVMLLPKDVAERLVGLSSQLRGCLAERRVGTRAAAA